MIIIWTGDAQRTVHYIKNAAFAEYGPDPNLRFPHLTHPLLPLRQLSLALELEQAGDLCGLAQQQSQGRGTRGNFRVKPGIGEGPHQQIEMEHLLGIPHKARQLIEIAFTQARAFPRAGAVRR